MNEIKAEHTKRVRVNDARAYAEQALVIMESLDSSAEVWRAFSILADIAKLEGRTEEARNYHRRERETFATFAGNRYHIDQQHGQLIAAIVVAAKSDTQARAEVEAILSQLEANNWHVADATRRIWAGERDWDSLVEGLDAQDALLILRVLETIEQSAEAQSITSEQVIASLPVTIREALEQGDQATFVKALEALPPEEQQAVIEAIQYLQSQQKEEE